MSVHADPAGSEGPFEESPDVETASEGYARRFSGSVGRYFLERQARLTLELLRDWPGARVLDVGGGHAQLAPPLLREGFDVAVTGSDVTCRARLDRLLPGTTFRFVVCDMLRLPFDDRSFDVVVAFRLMAHVSRWQTLLSEMCRVAREGVVIDFPARRSANIVQSPLFRLKKGIEKNTRPFRCFSRGEITAELARQGFGGVRFRPEFCIPMVVHRALRSGGVSRLLEGVGRGVGLGAFGSPVILRAVRLEIDSCGEGP